MEKKIFESLTDTHETTLSTAVMLATEHIAELDMREEFGLADFDAEAAIHATEAKLSQLGEGVREQLMSYLTHYALLRKLAPSWIDAENYADADGKILFHDLCHALDANEWQKSKPEFYSFFMSLAPAIESVVDSRYTIPW